MSVGLPSLDVNVAEQIGSSNTASLMGHKPTGSFFRDPNLIKSKILS